MRESTMPSISIKMQVSKPGEFELNAEVSIPDVRSTTQVDLDYCKGVIDWLGEMAKTTLEAK